MRIRRQGGLSLIELVMFLVIVSVALAGVLMVFNTAVKSSADPVIHKQMLAIAESLLTEIEQQPFTYCDPDDPNLASATSTAGCTGGAANSEDQNNGTLGPINSPTTTAETRFSATAPFDNVADYAGYSQNNVTDITGSNARAEYNASVAIARAGNVAPFAGVPADAVLRIAVTVTHGAESITLTGYRLRYAPNL